LRQVLVGQQCERGIAQVFRWVADLSEYQFPRLDLCQPEQSYQCDVYKLRSGCSVVNLAKNGDHRRALDDPPARPVLQKGPLQVGRESREIGDDSSYRFWLHILVLVCSWWNGQKRA